MKIPDTSINTRFKKTIRSDRAEARSLLAEAVWYLEALKRHGMAQTVDEYYFRLSLDEAIENAINHGNRGEYRKEIHVLVLACGKGVAISVRDEGGGYIPGNLSDPLDRENLFKNGGRGVHILKNIASVSWNRRGNRVTIRL